MTVGKVPVAAKSWMRAQIDTSEEPNMVVITTFEGKLNVERNKSLNKIESLIKAIALNFGNDTTLYCCSIRVAAVAIDSRINTQIGSAME